MYLQACFDGDGMELGKIIQDMTDTEINMHDNKGWTALHWCIINNDLELVKMSVIMSE